MVFRNFILKHIFVWNEYFASHKQPFYPENRTCQNFAELVQNVLQTAFPCLVFPRALFPASPILKGEDTLN